MKTELKTQPVSLRLPPDVRATIEDVARCSGRSFSSIANEMLAEAVKMRRIPGIVFADSPTGRVALLASTGLKVWLMIEAYRAMGEDWPRLRKAYHWLSEHQLRAALAYAQAYREEIDEAIRENQQLTPEVVWSTYPFTKPPWR